ncbi:hypothetical protein BDR22DRAFT_865495 [Usnea florida]
MRDAFSSPLKAIQGSAIIDLSNSPVRANKLSRARSPRWRPTDRSYSSLTTSLEPHGLRLSSVSVPTKPRYIPNQRPPPQVRSTVPKGAARQKDTSRKVVLSRFLLVDGSISFVVGTQVDGVVTPDVEEVPVAKILDHVSPAELERFENQDFFDEDERERLLPPRKPRGRRRAGDRPPLNVAPIGQATSREPSLLPDGSVTLKKKGGRPKGSLNKRTIMLNSAGPSSQSKGPLRRPRSSHQSHPYDRKTANVISIKPPALSKSSTSMKKPRGRPPRQSNIAVVVPSFNGPQPQELESTPGAETEFDEILAHPKPQYSMVIASGLGQSDTEEPTSRAQSVDLPPSSKKRRFVTSNGPIDLESDTDGGERSPLPSKKTKFLPETSPDPIADDSAALIRQFQARVYAPDQSAKPSTVPHGQFKPSSSLNGSTGSPARPRAHARSSSPGSSSSDSLMGHTQRPLKSVPAQHVRNADKPPLADGIPQRTYVGDPSDKVLASNFTNSKTVSPFPHKGPVKATPSKSNSLSGVIHRRASLTPHFPPGMKLSTTFPSYTSSESRSHPPVSSASTQHPSQQANTTFSQAFRSKPAPPKDRAPSPPPPRKVPSPLPHSAAPPPHTFQPSSSISKSNSAAFLPAPPKRNKFSPAPQTAPSTKSSQSSSKTSKIGFANVPPAKHITDYFAPKPKSPAPKTKAPTKKPAVHSPSLQLLGAAEDGEEEEEEEEGDSSESEDHLARRSPSSSKASSSSTDSEHDNDSTGLEEIIFVRQQTRTSPINARDPAMTEHDRMDIDSAVSSSDDDGKYDTAHESHTAEMGESRGSGGGLGQGFGSAEEEHGEDDDDDEEEEGGDEQNTTSSSDSVTSEVMVVRTR